MDKSYEEVKYKNKLIAIIIRSNFTSEKIVFFSPNNFSQQLGYLPHKKGHTIMAHFHKKVNRKITLTQEVLFIKKGKIIVDFYTNSKEYITSKQLDEGCILFLCSGGHGFKILEDTEMVEVKQGPYSGRDDDKEVFKG